MTRLFPYPILTAALLLIWLLLNGLTPGHVVLGAVIAFGASHAMTALQPSKPKLRRWVLLPRLLLFVLADVVRSNIAVSLIVLSGRGRARTAGFVSIPLELRDPTALAVLAVIITTTPGTAWVEYRSTSGALLIHVLDLTDDDTVVTQIKSRYETLLMEIFE